MVTSDYIAVSAAAISLCAFVATMWQGILTRKHNRLSVRPHINIVNQRVALPRGVGIKISAVNVGIGPAIVVDSWFSNSGIRMAFKEPRNQVAEVLEAIFADQLPYSFAQHGAIMKGAVLPAGHEHVLVEATFGSVRYEDASILDEYAKSVNYVLEYQSFYEERFKSDLRGVAQ